ncbi:DBH-like monooxygenase protein 2 homolog [Folsomia candida]|uniref:DBH-like monooxygenase protein 2 n=1 Tax=Folsomia candida TaxID=158441 RepID=A0A226EWP6_FOLCA|nr:DBH-like monooxygenase protein 2 homolog [Folsomia candida]OXA61494.1 DBH-like monooxygenase protein 2 [Folsomia candida]
MTFAKLCVFLTVCLAASDVLGGTVPINDGKYILETRVTLAGVLTVKVTAETTGWVGWGLSPNGSMILSDLVIGGFDASKGSYIGDRFSAVPGPPQLDAVQNVQLVSASENATHTVLEFTRAVDTGDMTEDIKVENAVQFIVWAVGPTDEIEYHGPETRGTIELNLMDG